MRLETITVRTSQFEAIRTNVSDLIAALGESTNPSVAVYLRNAPASDLCIHLLWHSGHEQADSLGVQLAAALMDYGSVDHAVWSRIERCDIEPNQPPVTR